MPLSLCPKALQLLQASKTSLKTPVERRSYFICPKTSLPLQAQAFQQAAFNSTGNATFSATVSSMLVAEPKTLTMQVRKPSLFSLCFTTRSERAFLVFLFSAAINRRAVASYIAGRFIFCCCCRWALGAPSRHWFSLHSLTTSPRSGTPPCPPGRLATATLPNSTQRFRSVTCAACPPFCLIASFF